MQISYVHARAAQKQDMKITKRKGKDNKQNNVLFIGKKEQC